MTEILMAVWNGGKYLHEQIDSILAQDCKDWTLTISDDGSTDGSAAVIDCYVQKYPDRIRRYHSGKRFGNARDHFFHLMAHSEGDWLLFCDQDDVWHQNKVRLFTAALRKAEAQYGKDDPILVFSDQAVVDEQLRPIAPSLMKLQQQDPEAVDIRNILFQNIVTGCTCGINRSMAKLAGQCLRPEETVMHDWWLALTAARFGHMVYLPESTIDYRQHGKNSVGAKNVRSLKYFLYKLGHREEMEKNRGNKKMQARVFLDTFSESLSEEDRKNLACYAARRSPFFWKLGYLPYINSWKRRAGFLIMQ